MIQDALIPYSYASTSEFKSGPWVSPEGLRDQYDCTLTRQHTECFPPLGGGTRLHLKVSLAGVDQDLVEELLVLLLHQLVRVDPGALVEPQVHQLDGVADAVRLGEQDALLAHTHTHTHTHTRQEDTHRHTRGREAESQRVGHVG